MGEEWDSPNLYTYVGNDPMNWIDPDGLEKIKVRSKWTGKIREFDDTKGFLTPKDIAGTYANYWAQISATFAGGALASGGGKAACAKLFGRGGWLNSNRYLRIGISRDGGRKVFRIAGDWVGKVKNDPHITIKDLGPL